MRAMAPLKPMVTAKMLLMKPPFEALVEIQPMAVSISSEFGQVPWGFRAWTGEVRTMRTRPRMERTAVSFLRDMSVL